MKDPRPKLADQSWNRKRARAWFIPVGMITLGIFFLPVGNPAPAGEKAPESPTAAEAGTCARDDRGAMTAPELPRVEPGLVFHAGREQPRVAITFDACETEKKTTGFDQVIWDTLVQKQVKATIFLGGKWMESHPEAARTIGANPLIELGNHSYVHPDFTRISDERRQEEIRKTQDVQYRFLGRQGIVFRFPYGNYNQAALESVAAAGLHAIQWDVTSGDPDPKMSASALYRSVFNQVQNGSIIIFHINTRGWHTGEALPGIVDELRARGYQLVTVSELMGYSAPAVPSGGCGACSAY